MTDTGENRQKKPCEGEMRNSQRRSVWQGWVAGNGIRGTTWSNGQKNSIGSSVAIRICPLLVTRNTLHYLPRKVANGCGLRSRKRRATGNHFNLSLRCSVLIGRQNGSFVGATIHSMIQGI